MRMVLVLLLCGTALTPVWAEMGLTVPLENSISTRFKSTTAIEMLDSWVFTKPLPRIVIDEPARKQGGMQTSQSFLSRKVKVEVNPSSSTSETTLTVKRTAVTASTRGTGFEFDENILLVNYGEVSLANRWNSGRSVTPTAVVTATVNLGSNENHG